MDLYFGSLQRQSGESTLDALVTFTIPDIGVRFKAPYKAEGTVVDYASLLTLLEFVDINPQLFSNRALELYSHNFELIQQINSCMVDDLQLQPYLQKALEYRKKLKYSINWISRPDNPAQKTEFD